MHNSPCLLVLTHIIFPPVQDAAGYDNSMDIDSMLQTADPPANNAGGNALGSAWSLNDEESEDEDNEDESPLIGNRLISPLGTHKR